MENTACPTSPRPTGCGRRAACPRPTSWRNSRPRGWRPGAVRGCRAAARSRTRWLTSSPRCGARWERGRGVAALPARARWKPRTPDAKDLAVLPHLYEARLLNADQLLRLYGLSSMGALHPRLVGLLAADGGPHILERGLGLDGRYVYALGPAGYKLLPAARRERVRHRPLASLALSPQFLDHALAV